MVGTLRIFTDSTADMTLEELRNYQVGVFPLNLNCGGETFVDDRTVDMAALWARMESGQVLTTSQPPLQRFLDVFEAAQRQGDSVVYVSISSALSGTYQTAVAAKNMVSYPEIYIVDGRRAAASAAEKLVVLRACALRDQGLSAGDIARALCGYRERVRLFACLDTLEYLVRGGRLSKLSGAVGSALSIKPIIGLNEDGGAEVLKKLPGLKRATAALCDIIQAHPIDKDFPIIPIFAKDSANCMVFLKTLAAQLGGLHCSKPMEIGPTIGCHIGPGGFGLVYTEVEA